MPDSCLSVITFPGTPCWMQHVGYWINQHQTLLTGVAALAVGWATIHYLQRQIAQQRDLAEAETKRRLRAVRAGLPFALSEIHDYSRECVNLLCHFLTKGGSLNGEDEYDFELEQQTLSSLPVTPKYPAEAFKSMQIVIEHASPADAKKLQEIVAFGQIQHTRFHSLIQRVIHKKDASWIVTPDNVMSAIRDAIGLMLHAERVYDYARESGPDIHELGDARKASDTLLWMNMGGSSVRTYVSEHWPPDFPRKIPQQGTSFVPPSGTDSDEE